ncbi:MAG: isoaspartyl peptidase/L-asparaginase [Candidatus Obscuribacterales bacterium]|nr:isoaspartyl peptidase/L-asparaginase [Candidatus Obscuribacterales bacterium]
MSMPAKAVLLVHGGAGVINPGSMSEALESRYKNKLGDALVAGHKVLKAGGTSLDAVVAAIKVLEDSPLFNAGKGAVLTRDKRIELDAAIMDGASLQAGAVGAITNVKNPITAARAVMEHTEHVMLIGKGAEVFLRNIAKKIGLTLVEPDYFVTARRLEQLEDALAREVERFDSTRSHKGLKLRKRRRAVGFDENKFGTVGAVALDEAGNLAAATSTGGITAKRYGRVGDSPLIGSGTYADNDTCAVSCTGHGEYFIRHVASYDVCARMKYLGEPVSKAVQKVISSLGKAGGDGGMIALDRKGNAVMSFNTSGMFRGAITEDGEVSVAIYCD